MLRRVPLQPTTSPSLVSRRTLTLNQGSNVTSQPLELRMMVASIRTSGARKTCVLTPLEQVPLTVTEACGWSNRGEVGATLVVSVSLSPAMILKGWHTPDSERHQAQRANNLGELSPRLGAASAPLPLSLPSRGLQRRG